MIHCVQVFWDGGREDITVKAPGKEKSCLLLENWWGEQWDEGSLILKEKGRFYIHTCFCNGVEDACSKPSCIKGLYHMKKD